MIPVSEHDVVVIGGSAGAIEALGDVLGGLAADIPARIAVVLHTTSAGSTRLAEVIRRRSPIPVVYGESGGSLQPGVVHVAPPGHHLLVGEADTMWLSHGARVNRARPAVDPLFRSAARWYGGRVIGVVLSGSLDDGAAGLAAIVAEGGAALVQDPGDAAFTGMPRAALRVAPQARALPAAALGPAIMQTMKEPAGERGQPDPDLVRETDLERPGRTSVSRGGGIPGRPTSFACPECRGAMAEIELAGAIHFRCHVGHSYTPRSLIAAQSEAAESMLWSAVSILEEQAMVHRMLAERAVSADEREGHTTRADRAADAADAVRAQITG